MQRPPRRLPIFMTKTPALTGRTRRLLLGLALLLLVTACATGYVRPGRDIHVVRSGETLFTIAWRYGRDHRDLARWNKLGDGSLIYPGQRIRLTPPAHAARAPAATRPGTTPRQPAPLPTIPASPAPDWQWPTSGKVAVEFGQRPGTGTGVLIAGRTGQSVVAAADGRVVYAGGGLIGYGELIIVKHNDTYLSAYGYNASLLVKEGQSVKQGQRIATMGEGPEQKPRLHFEIRRNGKPVNPRQFMPAR